MKKNIFFMVGALCLLLSATAYAEDLKGTDANIVGHVIEKSTGEHLPYMTVSLKGTTIGTMTDATGHYFLKNLPEGEFALQISAIGYKSQDRKVILKRGKTLEENFELEEDLVALDGVVVTANRNETARRLAPTLVNVVTPKLFDLTNSHTLSQGLVFQPGVRVETDCQNCGYSQVRINGLDGKYTQILIDSRPIFSALAGVYGLEQIPANMIERVEVVRGGGSALFGSSAIAGTVNIITKEPIRNSGSFSHSISNFDGSGSFDNNTTLNLSLVSSDNKMGAYIYGQNRHRSAWDSNGDGFSELPKLRNQTVGLNAYYRTSAYSKLSLEYHHMEEFRRGGSGFGLPPHIAENADLNGTGEPGLVEQLRHSINTGGLKFTAFSRDQKHTFSTYASAQHIVRDSYYSAYGMTTDFTGVLGAQYIYHFDKCLFMPSDLTGGVEFNHDNLHDKATDMQKYRDAALDEDPGATGNRLQQLIDKYTPAPLNQVVNIASAYVQNEWNNEQWSFLIGARVDKNSIMDKAVFSPRANIRYNPTQDVNIRFSYAEGFRAPQAFDEDLHISNVGGELVSIVRAKGLKEERSRSLNASVDWYHYFGNFQANFLIEGFYTKLSDPFVLTPPVKDPAGSGYLLQTRVNGSGAKVYGGTLEGKIAYRDKIQLQAGITVQRSIYDSSEEWSADEEHLSEKERRSDKILRTPDVYGYFTATYTPVKPLSMALNGNYTGRMYVPHLMSEVNGTADVLVKSPTFFELGAKLAYDIDFTGICLQFNVGVQNIFNSYQNDFDKGASRDSGYIYGPGAPRSYFAGVKLSF
ncbi:TonB-dependent receptor [Bacteroides fluxus]